MPTEIVSFNDDNVEDIMQSLNDALVISVLINKSRVKRVLIDPRSSANVIRSRVIDQLGLQDQIVPAVRVLNGFNITCEITKGEITLQVTTTGTIQEIKFYVIEGDMRYNALFGRPWIHNMRAVPSTLYQELQYPTSGEVKTIYEEQPTAKEMFAVDKVVSIFSLSTPNNLILITKEETNNNYRCRVPAEPDK
uniref:Uncharacterized protein LOC104235584 n=1 Tax=Nicotiana sylvestris TaxID=4096 RepID=A0A1U7XA00_NICSY|nr:PREDICTED: uncharacterized protein LOC104235584 [Nicotiana sylvestris]